MTVLKSDIIKMMSEEFDYLSNQDINSGIKAIFDAITQGMIDGKCVQLRGFGSFLGVARKSNKARNPQDGTPITVLPFYKPRFKPSKKLNAQINARVHALPTSTRIVHEGE